MLGTPRSNIIGKGRPGPLPGADAVGALAFQARHGSAFERFIPVIVPSGAAGNHTDGPLLPLYAERRVILARASPILSAARSSS